MSVLDNIRFIFLYIDKYSMGKEWYFPEAVIPYNMFRYICKGSAEFFIDGEKVEVKENQIVYIPIGCRMSCQATSDSFEFYSIRFTTSVVYEGEDLLKRFYGIPRITENTGDDFYFKEIYKWVKSEHAAKKCFIRGYLNILIGALSDPEFDASDAGMEDLEPKADASLEKLLQRGEKSLYHTDPRIQAVVDYVILNPTEKYTIERMADMANLSKQRFTALFKQNTGKAPMEYLRDLRLTTAARRLLVCNDNISDIAYGVGYEDPNYFIREFKKRFGFTPNQYRKEGEA